MPWELGVVDSHTKNCAIMPLSKLPTPSKSYKGLEYLSLYPFVSRELDTINVMKLWVVEESDKYVTIENWISGSKPSFKSTNIF